MLEQFMAGFGSGLGKGLGDSMQATPSGASGALSSMFDSSGWNVNFGAGNIESSRSQTPAGPMDAMAQYLPYMIGLVGVVVAWKMLRKSR